MARFVYPMTTDIKPGEQALPHWVIINLDNVTWIGWRTVAPDVNSDTDRYTIDFGIVGTETARTWYFSDQVARNQELARLRS